MIAIHKETGEVIRMGNEVRAADGRYFQWSQLIFHPEPVDEFQVKEMEEEPYVMGKTGKYTTTTK